MKIELDIPQAKYCYVQATGDVVYKCKYCLDRGFICRCIIFDKELKPDAFDIKDSQNYLIEKCEECLNQSGEVK